jgi:hypothetical protein
MARKLNLQIPQFKSSPQILGCVAHVINLTAKIGIGALGSINYEDEGRIISMADWLIPIWNPKTPARIIQ